MLEPREREMLSELLPRVSMMSCALLVEVAWTKNCTWAAVQLPLPVADPEGSEAAGAGAAAV